MIDATTSAPSRRGRKPKADKRVPLSLLVSPALRGRLVAMAEETRRSITRQTELLLEQGVEKHVSKPSFLVANGYRSDNSSTDVARGVGARAGAFLEINYPGGGKDARIARELEISAGMAKLLRSGRGWTVARLDQAIQLWPGFRDFVFAPADDRLVNRLEQLALGLARLANQIGELRQQLLADQSTCDDQAKERAA